MIDYTKYKGMTPSQIYGANPNGLAPGWNWADFDRVNGTQYSTAAGLPGTNRTDFTFNDVKPNVQTGVPVNTTSTPSPITHPTYMDIGGMLPGVNNPPQQTPPQFAGLGKPASGSVVNPLGRTSSFFPTPSSSTPPPPNGATSPTGGVTKPFTQNTGVEKSDTTTPPPPNEGTTTPPPANNTLNLPGTGGQTFQYTPPDGFNANNVFGNYGNPIDHSNQGNYLDGNGNPTTDPNWLNSQNLPDWLKSQFRWNPGDMNIGGGTPGHWEYAGPDGSGGAHGAIRLPSGQTVYRVGTLMNDPGKYIKNPSDLKWDKDVGWYVTNEDSVDWSAAQESSWHRGDYINAAAIIASFAGGVAFPNGITGGFEPGNFLNTSGGAFAPGAATSVGEGATGGLGATGASSAGFTPSTGGLTNPLGGSTATYNGNTITVTPSGSPVAGPPTTPPVPPPGPTGGGNPVSRPTTPPPSSTTTQQPPPNGGNTGHAPAKPNWFPGSQDTWNNLYGIYSAGRFAAAGISFYNFVAGMTGLPTIGGNSGNPIGRNGSSGSDGGLDLGGLVNTGIGAYLNQQLINKYGDMFNDMYTRGDYNAQYRPGQLARLNDFLMDPSKALDDPTYQAMRDRELGNESRMLAARGFNMSGNELGDLASYQKELDYKHINDVENQLRSAAQLGNPDQMARAGIQSLPFMFGMMSNANNDLMSGLNRSGAINTVSNFLNRLFGSNGPPTTSDGSFDFSQFTSDQLNNFTSLGMPDPHSDPAGAEQWMQQFTTGQIPVDGFTDDVSDGGPPPDGFDSWDAFFAWLIEGGTPDGEGAGP